MLHIRNTGLYKAKYGTFEGYLEKRWEIAKSRGYQILTGVEFVQKLEHFGKNDSDKNLPIGKFSAITFPANEGQIRPLINGLKNDSERLHVWSEVVKQATEDAANAPEPVDTKKQAKPQNKITALLVQREVDKFNASGVVVDDVVIELPSVTDKDLLSESEKLKREKQQR